MEHTASIIGGVYVDILATCSPSRLASQLYHASIYNEFRQAQSNEYHAVVREKANIHLTRPLIRHDGGALQVVEPWHWSWAEMPSWPPVSSSFAEEREEKWSLPLSPLPALGRMLKRCAG